MQSPISSPSGEEPELRVFSLTPASASPSPSIARLWKPAAQRNLRNQWSRLLSNKRQWESAVSEGRSSATALVNTYLSCRYMPDMNLGVLKDMPEILQKACKKLAWKRNDAARSILSLSEFKSGCSEFLMQGIPCDLEQCQSKLLSSYKDLVDIVCQWVEACGSMRCFLKGSSAGPLVQFTHHSQDKNDPGDGEGIAVFSFWPLSYFEKLAQELAGMFVLEINFKRLIVVQLLSIGFQETSRAQIDEISWSSELYQGEFDDLDLIALLCKEGRQPIPPRIKDFQSDNLVTEKVNQNPDREVLQVYLTAWISDVNVDMKRVDEIFAMVEEEMKVKLS